MGLFSWLFRHRSVPITTAASCPRCGGSESYDAKSGFCLHCDAPSANAIAPRSDSAAVGRQLSLSPVDFLMDGRVTPYVPCRELKDIVPSRPGIYGWYFDSALLSHLPLEEWRGMSEWKILYIGIAGWKKKRTLTQRIYGCHINGSADNSTFRKSVGAILATELSLCLERSGNSCWTFGSEGEGRLSAWLKEHARVAWIEDSNPSELEKYALSQFGHLLPLNSHGNRDNKYRRKLRELRRNLYPSRQDLKQS